jgi:hypothetical protein
MLLPASIHKKVNAISAATVLLLLLFLTPYKSGAYSLLTHEAIVDVSWKKSIEPLLLKKYPKATAEDLLLAHSYAYGGAIMPDIGYSPFGSMIYTDFVHNIRTGDYIEALLEEAQDLNEYAFALGSLAHYTADNYGHLYGTNIAVPLVYPKIKKQYGSSVTYAQNKASHSQMELSFDVLQTARGNYATQAYHDFIGFNISRPVIEKAFYRTYGLYVNDVFGNMSVAISTFRWTIKTFLPMIVRAAWAKKKSELKKTSPDAHLKKFSYHMKNRTYYHEFGKDHQKTGFFPTVFSVLIPVLPKVGPLAKLKFKTPTIEVERIFARSFDSTLVHYEKSLTQLHTGRVKLPNRTLDTGHETVYDGYPIANKNYAVFILLLSKNNFQSINPEIKNNVLVFFSKAQPPENKKDKAKWVEISKAIVALNQYNIPLQK